MRRLPRLTYTTLASRLMKKSLNCYSMMLKPALVYEGELLSLIANKRAAHPKLGQVQASANCAWIDLQVFGMSGVEFVAFMYRGTN